MTKALLFLLFGLFVLHSFAKKDTIITYYDRNGNEVKKRYCSYYQKIFKTDETTYGFLQYYSSGGLEISGSLLIENGAKTGPFLYYHKNGVKIKEENYTNDKKNGSFKTWYSYGVQESEGTYLQDKKSGLWTYWYFDGTVSGQGEYLNDYKTGEWKTWYLGGEIASTGTYQEDKKEGAWKAWFKSGVLDQEGSYKNDKREGVWVFYFESGKISARETYENGVAMKVEFWDEYGNTVTPGEILEKDPEFPGGEQGMAEFIRDNIMYPELAREMGEQGIVYVGFSVKTDGTISEVRIIKGVSEILDAEARRVIRKMPNWAPGTSHNRMIQTDYMIPITFTIAG